MDSPHLAGPTENSSHPVSSAGGLHIGQPSPSPGPSTPGARGPRRRPPKLRRRQSQDAGKRQPPPDTAMPLANPAGSSLSAQDPRDPEWRHSRVDGPDAGPDDEREHGHMHEHEHERDPAHLNTHPTKPSSDAGPPSEAEDTSSLGAGSTPAPAPAPAPTYAQNSRQQIELDRSQDREGRESQQLMQIDDLENLSGQMVRDIQTKTVGTRNGAREGVIEYTSRHGHETGKGLQERRTSSSHEQSRLRLDLNLDLEVQLKAKIRGDLTLQLMYGFSFVFGALAG
ncbi:hypothetical protein BDW66DRAFT_151505 [Aspergillus desertorum]